MAIRTLKNCMILQRNIGSPHYSTNLSQLLMQTKPDLLDIAGNPHFRLEAVREAVKHESIKLINIEKPLALLPEDVYEIEQLCARHHKLVTVNHQKKFLPALSKAKEAIQSGQIGEFEFIRATCQGNLLEQGTHLVDMVLHFTNSHYIV